MSASNDTLPAKLAQVRDTETFAAEIGVSVATLRKYRMPSGVDRVIPRRRDAILRALIRRNIVDYRTRVEDIFPPIETAIGSFDRRVDTLATLWRVWIAQGFLTRQTVADVGRQTDNEITRRAASQVVGGVFTTRGEA